MSDRAIYSVSNLPFSVVFYSCNFCLWWDASDPSWPYYEVRVIQFECYVMVAAGPDVLAETFKFLIFECSGEGVFTYPFIFLIKGIWVCMVLRWTFVLP